MSAFNISDEIIEYISKQFNSMPENLNAPESRLAQMEKSVKTANENLKKDLKRKKGAKKQPVKDDSKQKEKNGVKSSVKKEEKKTVAKKNRRKIKK